MKNGLRSTLRTKGFERLRYLTVCRVKSLHMTRKRTPILQEMSLREVFQRDWVFPIYDLRYTSAPSWSPPNCIRVSTPALEERAKGSTFLFTKQNALRLLGACPDGTLGPPSIGLFTNKPCTVRNVAMCLRIKRTAAQSCKGPSAAIVQRRAAQCKYKENGRR